MSLDSKKNETVISFNNVGELYRQAVQFDEKEGSYDYFMKFFEYKDHWGFKKEEVESKKWGDSTRLEEVKKLQENLEIETGGRKKYKWDTDDGDVMDMERYMDESPFLRKRIKTTGEEGGKFITLYVDIAANCGVSSKAILYKSAAVAAIVDYLENMGYVLEIILIHRSQNKGSYKGVTMPYTTSTVMLKRAGDPLNLSLLMTCISPWFLRHWLFMFWCAKFKVSWGLGQPTYEESKSIKGKLIINGDECLDKQSAEIKLKELKKLYS